MRKHIPNFLTLMNLASGFLGILAILSGKPLWAFYLLGGSLFFDFLDGMAARLLHAGSEIGKDLDSLADLVSFGVVPALLCALVLGSGENGRSLIDLKEPAAILLAVSPVILVLASALRLARFNHDPRQHTSFIGLPTPANGVFFASLAYLVLRFPASAFAGFTGRPLVLLPLLVVFSWLMVSPIPMFSLKFHDLRFRGNEIRFLFIGISAILLILLHWFAIPLVIGLYILISIGLAIFSSAKKTAT